MTNIEIWQPLPGNNRYEISNTGKVWDNRKITLVKPHNAGRGYLGAMIDNDVECKSYGIHRLVLWAFWGVLSSHPRQCNHKDGNKHNNHLSNLELVSPKENNLHAIRAGLNRGHPTWKKNLTPDN